MRVITIQNRKGGTGKSVITHALAFAAAEARENVIVFDLDPNQTHRAWLADRQEPDPPKRIVFDEVAPDELPKLKTILAKCEKQGYTLAILDTQGVNTPATTMAAGVAQLCLLPTPPTSADIRMTIPAYRVIERLRRPAAFVLSRCPPHPKALRTVEAAETLSTVGPVAEPAIKERADYRDANDMGLGVTELAPKSKAADDARALWRWVKTHMKKMESKA